MTKPMARVNLPEVSILEILEGQPQKALAAPEHLTSSCWVVTLKQTSMGCPSPSCARKVSSI